MLSIRTWALEFSLILRKRFLLNIPQDITVKFDPILIQKKIPESEHNNFRKWLRYYFDFCKKYHYPESKRESLPHFIKKLQEKHQSANQQKQAAFAISLYYSIVLPYPEDNFLDSENLRQKMQPSRKQKRSLSPIPNNIVTSPSGPIDSKKSVTIESARGWTQAIHDLSSLIKIKHYSPKTLWAYTNWVKKFQGFIRNKEVQSLSSVDVKDFMEYLAVKRKVAASTQNQAFNALLFFYKHIIKKDFGDHSKTLRAKRRHYIPVVLSREEVHSILEHLIYPNNLIVKLLYGCGLRMFECLNLRINNFNFDAGILTVHDGKGKKDRTVPLPETILPELKAHLERVKNLYKKDLNSGFDGAFMFDAIEKKYKNCAKELVWQWFFPAKKLTTVPDTKEIKRYHFHETHVQVAIKGVVKKLGICKRVATHTFRHSFATHLLQANYDIRTIQELLGHSDVRTTMIYTHTIKSQTVKEAKSPLDF